MRQTKHITPLQLLSHSYLPHSTHMHDTKEQCNMQNTKEQHAKHKRATCKTWQRNKKHKRHDSATSSTRGCNTTPSKVSTWPHAPKAAFLLTPHQPQSPSCAHSHTCVCATLHLRVPCARTTRKHEKQVKVKYGTMEHEGRGRGRRETPASKG